MICDLDHFPFIPVPEQIAAATPAQQLYEAAQRLGFDRMTLDPCITAMLSFAQAGLSSLVDSFPDSPDSLKEPVSLDQSSVGGRHTPRGGETS